MVEKKTLFEKGIPSRFLNQINGKSPRENYKSEKERIKELFEEKQVNEEIEEVLHEQVEKVFEDLFKGWK